MDRRSFIKSTIGISLAAGLAPAKAQVWAGQENKNAVLKLSSQESKIPGQTLAEKIVTLDSWGARGIEIHGNPVDRIKEIKSAIKGTNVKVSALCWGSAKGSLVSADPQQRNKGIDEMKSALNTAGELESTGVIFVPAFNRDTNQTNQEIRKILIDILPELGEQAQKCSTRVLLEPLNRKEAFFLRLLADAAAICRDVNNPGIAMMGDFYHMNIEETSDCGAFLSSGKFLHHVHLASATRKLPGQDEKCFVDGFRGLKMIGYQDYCSLECGINGDPNIEIPKSFRFLEKQWEEVKI